MSLEIPNFKDKRHQRFADAVLAGHAPAKAYKMAGFTAKTPQSRSAAASRLLKNVIIAKYISEIQKKAQEQAAEVALLSAVEKRTKFARIFRANILQIDPTNKNDPNADLLKKVKIREKVDPEGNVDRVIEFEIHDALAAARDDNKLSGDDPEASALQVMAEAFARLGHQAGTLPVDKM
jgi:phage terminase small subunit